MKFKIFLMTVICSGMVLAKGVFLGSPKKINEKGEYQPYYGYAIAAMIDTKLRATARQIEEFIRRGSLRKRYAALPASSYHMTFYSIYQYNLIPPVKRWVKTTREKIFNRKWLPYRVLNEQNKKATCIIESYLNDTLNIKYANVNISKTTISLTIELEKETLERIQNARKELAKIYDNKDSSMEPINKKLQITLAYAHGIEKTVDTDAWNHLNQLAKSFNGAKLSRPSVYLFASMKEYIPFRKTCTSYTNR